MMMIIFIHPYHLIHIQDHAIAATRPCMLWVKSSKHHQQDTDPSWGWTTVSFQPLISPAYPLHLHLHWGHTILNAILNIILVHLLYLLMVVEHQVHTISDTFLCKTGSSSLCKCESMWSDTLHRNANEERPVFFFGESFRHKNSFRLVSQFSISNSLELDRFAQWEETQRKSRFDM